MSRSAEADGAEAAPAFDPEQNPEFKHFDALYRKFAYRARPLLPPEALGELRRLSAYLSGDKPYCVETPPPAGSEHWTRLERLRGDLREMLGMQAWQKRQQDWCNVTGGAPSVHRAAVVRALANRKRVRVTVLADYPDLG